MSIQHKGFPNELLNLLKICVNICWDLLQATYSTGKQMGADIEGNGTDGLKKKGNLTFLDNYSVYVSKKKWCFLKPTQEYISMITQLLYAS